MKRLSVIIPCYNVEFYIKETVDSVLNQGIEDIEIILVNDGSTDDTLKILRAIELKSNVVVVDGSNHGVSIARNIGMTMAKGEYLLFLDGDDLLEPQVLKLWLNLAREEQLDICFGGYCDVDMNLEQVLRINHNLLNDVHKGYEVLQMRLLKQIWICTGNAIYRRALIEHYGIRYLEGKAYGEDAFFINTVLFRASRVASLNQNVLKIRIRPNSALTSVTAENYIIVLDLNRKFKNEILDNTPQLLRAIEHDYCNLYLGYVKIFFNQYGFRKSFQVKQTLNHIDKPIWGLIRANTGLWLQAQLYQNCCPLYYLVNRVFREFKRT